MYFVRLGLDPRDRERSLDHYEVEKTTAVHSSVTLGAISWLTIATVLLLIAIIVGNVSALHSKRYDARPAASLELFGQELVELDERIPRGWQ